jgi:hypothetical protein
LIASNGTTLVAFEPIEKRVNESLDKMSQIMDISSVMHIFGLSQLMSMYLLFFQAFSSSNALDEFYRIFNSFNLCQEIFWNPDNPNDLCTSIADGTLTMGVNAINT